jgi:hypothetical protein
MEFQAALQIYQKRQLLYESNTIKAYALFWGRCTKGMRNKIKARTDYGTKIKNNLIKLVKAIKKYLLGYQENCYNMAVILNSLKTLVNIRQKEGETLQDYTKRFRVTRKVFKTQIGGMIAMP